MYAVTTSSLNLATGEAVIMWPIVAGLYAMAGVCMFVVRVTASTLVKEMRLLKPDKVAITSFNVFGGTGSTETVRINDLGVREKADVRTPVVSQHRLR